MLATAGLALNFCRLFPGHVDYDVVGIFSAFGAVGFDRITGGKSNVLQSISPLFEASQDMADKNHGDGWI